MKKILVITTMLVISLASADGLQVNDYCGSWTANVSPSKGESNFLQISGRKGAKFVRDYGNAPKREMLVAPPQSLTFVDDILIIDFRNSPEKATYKLVLAGLETTHDVPTLVGTVFMYLNGEMVSGMPIAFRKSGE